MKIIKSVLLFFILLHYVTSFTQEQNNQWRFGFGGGIDFNTNPPSFSAGAVISTPEGSASVADRTTGALLFYTDGVTVWNANNQVMLNGTGLLGGTPALLSSTTAAVIIPKPGNSNLYYIVTIDEQASSNGMRYSLVDMTLDNGLGAVVSGQKNIFLFQTTSEKLEVVPASDKQSYWLLTHDEPGNSFVAFRINATGIQNTPVVSTVGNTQSNGAGHMKINRQFNKLAIGVTFSSALELFDFNNTTGVVSNPITWNYTLTSPLIYGVEFSPDGSKLYVTNLDKLLQFDISLSSASAIQNSVYQFNTGFALPAALQLGPDDKIYLNVGSISVINCPNSPGASCGFQENAIANQSGGGGYGLPKWVYYFDDHPVTNTILYSDTCLANSIQFSIQNSASITSVSWNFGDPASGLTNNAVGLTPSHTFSQAGNYTIQAILTTICGTDTLTLSSLSINDCTNEGPSITGIKLVGDTCDLPASIAFQAEGTSNSPYFFWNFDDPASGVNDTITITGFSPTPFPTHTFTAPGNYTVCVQFQEPGFPVTTVCKTISIGNCDTSTIESCALFVPNVFTPNGDQIHDSFYPELSCSAAAYELVILNRWGGEVFKTSVQTDKWDGKFNGNDCTNGVYFYKLAYQFPTQQLQIVSGIITLLR
jgi:gliding motility-associated-like protein